MKDNMNEYRLTEARRLSGDMRADNEECIIAIISNYYRWGKYIRREL